MTTAQGRLTGTYLMWSKRGGAQAGASIAFYSIFALAPLLVVAIAIAGLALDGQRAGSTQVARLLLR